MKHSTQTAYARAKTAYDKARASWQQACERAGLVYRKGMSDAEFERVDDAVERLRTKYRVNELQTALMHAENAMVAWMLSVMNKHPNARGKDIAETAKQAMTSPKFRDRMVDMARRFSGR